MKTLIIGMDGATIDTFKRGWTPFIASLLEKGKQLGLKEDLISRGWAEIFTGKHGQETGALYDRPDADGSLGWSLQFHISDIPGLGTEIRPLWQVLNERGYKVGIMNLPTAYPAPEVDGFFVSGGGGGGRVIQDPTEDLCYPKSILSSLLKEGYIVDERFGSLIYEKGIKDEKNLFSRLGEKNKNRTKAFIRLSSEFDVDFGFVVYKSSSVMAELLTIPEMARAGGAEEDSRSPLLAAAREYYRSFDTQVKRLVEAFQGAEVIFVSDHGMSTTTHLVHLNLFLQENGFQQATGSVSVSEAGLGALKKFLKPLIPLKLRHMIKQKTSLTAFADNPIVFDKSRTLAFTMPQSDWCSGIYINDKKRFNGPVAVSEIPLIARQIADCINKDSFASSHGLKGAVKPEMQSPASTYFPDVLVSAKNGYLFSNAAKDFIVKFNQPDGPLTLKQWIQDYRPYCIKAHDPIAVSTKGWAIQSSDKKRDLRLVYDHILATFQG